ncbi:tetratricopeptide repeat protein [Piscinibacter sp. HJYY11]|uniref:tetratricopeptide repeat protein n=1 Tax=Piscinibacter sp. HJYY11 TaxID=2801333 RepID=UPI00191DF0CE|nr:tetratricopeptide repeat protein [Piscinibacter sp. HJYY11]MBL0730997.1 tetratricopeptide repeat protein [Piscinibacter sp. HJYY11]
MPSADRLTSCGALLAALCLTGCASLFDSRADEAAPAPAAPVAPAPVAAATQPRVAAAAAPAAPAASAPAPKAAEPELAAITPAAQRAFDDARRAMRAGRMDDAERGFKSLIQFHPELGGPHANLGLIYRQANKLPEAVAALEQATKVSPRQPVYFNQLGITYRMQGQFAKAREAYERAIDLDGNYAAPVLNLGVLYDLYLWDPKRAAEHYDRYLAMSPGGDANVTKWLADLRNRKPPAAAAAAPAAAPRKEKE